jgi:hypothetical protein
VTDAVLGAYRLFGEHVPMRGFRVVAQVGVARDALHGLLRERARHVPAIDPELAGALVRAGAGLVQTGLVEFAWSTPEDTFALLPDAAVLTPGACLEAEDRLLAVFAARLALLLGREVPCVARLYELPDLTVVTRAFTQLQEGFEERTPLRSALWLGCQMEGRGEGFHPAMIETLEEQTHLLQDAGVDLERLPPWWWRGIATRGSAGGIEVHDELPAGEAFAALLAR